MMPTVRGVMAAAMVVLVGAVGADANAEPATALLRDAGVDLAHVEDVEDVTGLAVITVAAGGENTVLVVPGANALVGGEYVQRHAAAIEAAELVLLQGEIPADGFARAVELTRGRVVVNLAPVVDVPREAAFCSHTIAGSEPFVVTGGGPGNSTTFLSIDLVKMAIGQFDLGPAAAFSLIYFLVILLISWVFYTVMTNAGTERPVKEGAA